MAEDHGRQPFGRRAAGIRYEDVDTSLMPPRPRLYGVAGAKLIEQVWKERQASEKSPPA